MIFESLSFLSLQKKNSVVQTDAAAAAGSASGGRVPRAAEIPKRQLWHRLSRVAVAQRAD